MNTLSPLGNPYYITLALWIWALCPSPQATAQELDIDNLRGTVPQSQTIGGAISLTSDLIIPEDITLTIAAGSTVRSNSGFSSIFVSGTLIVNGPVTFTSVEDSAPNQWGGIVFRPNSSGSLDQVTMRNGGGETFGLVDIDANAQVVVQNSHFANSSGDGIWIRDAAPTIAACIFTDNQGAAIRLNGSSFPLFSGDLGPATESIWIQSTTLDQSGTWHYAGIPYVLNGDVRVPEEIALTIAPRVVVKGNNTFNSLDISGTLTAEGTAAEPVIFTAFEDDTISGDTNKDANAETPAVPAPNQWGGIIFRPNSSGSLNQVILRYGGGETAGLVDIGANAQVTIQNVHFANSSGDGIWIQDADPTIAACTFTDNLGAAIRLSGNSFPRFNGDLGPTTEGIWIQSTTLDQNGTWHYAGIPYVLNGDVTVAAGTALTIAPGVAIKTGNRFLSVHINGNLLALGKPDSAIVFTALRDDTVIGDTNKDATAETPAVPAPGQWGGIVFRPNSSGNLDQVILRYGGGETTGLVDIDATDQVHIQNSHFANSSGDGIWIQDADPTIAACTFTDNQSAAIRLIGSSFPRFNGDLGPATEGIWIQTTTLDQSGTWHHAGIPYVLNGDLAIPAEIALTVAPRVVVKSNSSFNSLRVSGILTAEGTATQPIIFTSFQDDVIGDTNKDANAETPLAPAPGQWGGIVFRPGSSGNLNQVTMRYGGGETAGLVDIDATDQVHIQNSHFANSSGDGIWIRNADPTIAACTFADNQSAAIRLSGSSFPRFNGGLGPATEGIWIQTTTFAQSGTWHYAGIPYVLNGDVIIPAEIALTIAPGVAIKNGSRFQSLFVSGSLVALGKPDSAIVFTSLQDDTVVGDTNKDGDTTGPAPNDWGGVRILGGGSTTMEYCQLRYGSGENSALVRVDRNGGAALNHCSLVYSGNQGLHTNLESAVFIHNSTIAGNLGAGVFNNSTESIDATGNWWGDASGPLDGSDLDGRFNPEGLGDYVSDFVEYAPWLSAPSDTGTLPPFSFGQTPKLIGDFNGDDLVDMEDFLLFAQNYDQVVEAGNIYDLTGDGLVDFNDYFLFAQNFGSARD